MDYAGKTVTKEISVKNYDYKNKTVTVSCDTLTARDAGARVEFKLVDGGVDIFTFTTGLETYTACLDSGAATYDICTALMKYCDSAAAYFAK